MDLPYGMGLLPMFDVFKTPPINGPYVVSPINDDTERDIDRRIWRLYWNNGFLNDSFQSLMIAFDSYTLILSDNEEDSESYLISYYDSILKFRLESSKILEKIICELLNLQYRILDVELDRWIKEEQLYGNMFVQINEITHEYPFNQDILKVNLKIIQNWCKDLIKAIFFLKKN